MLLLQVQAFAAGTLDCRHSGQQSDAMLTAPNAACTHAPFLPQGEHNANESDGSALGDFQKCSLGLCLLGGLGLIRQDSVPILHRPPTFASAPARHFYRFSPEQGVRPPIPRSC